MVKKFLNTTRRELLQYSGSMLAASVLSPGALAAIKLTGDSNDNLTRLSAAEAVSRMKAGDLDAETYAGDLIQRAREKKDLNAFLALDPEHVFEAARHADAQRLRGETPGALHGLPIPVKDSIFTRAYPTTGGTPALQSLDRRIDAPLIRRLKSAGGYVMGKTNLHELSTGHTSNNEMFGAVRNPFDPSRIPGGSSGGTAVAVATGMAPMGIGEDTFGSIRVPAALCGVAGFRPTTGRYPNEEVIPLTPEFDQLGPLARSVSDILLFDNVMTGTKYDGARPPLNSIRLGIPRGYFYKGLASDARLVIEDALERLTRAGATLVEADIPDVENLLQRSYLPILNYRTWRVLDAYLRELGFEGGLPEVLEEAGPGMRAFYENNLAPGSPNAVSESAYRQGLQMRERLRQVVQDYFTGNNLDAVVFPTTLSAATPIGDAAEITIDGKTVPLVEVTGHNQSLAPACELPALTLPAGLTRSGLPVGIEFEAPSGEDERLLRLGLSLETALGTLPETVLG